MALFKQFRFFNSDLREAVAAPSNVCCSATGGGSLWLGCADGTVVVLAAGDLSLQASFQAHQGRVQCLEWAKVGRVAAWSPP